MNIDKQQADHEKLNKAANDITKALARLLAQRHVRQEIKALQVETKEKTANS